MGAAPKHIYYPSRLPRHVRFPLSLKLPRSKEFFREALRHSPGSKMEKKVAFRVLAYSFGP